MIIGLSLHIRHLLKVPNLSQLCTADYMTMEGGGRSKMILYLGIIQILLPLTHADEKLASTEIVRLENNRAIVRCSCTGNVSWMDIVYDNNKMDLSAWWGTKKMNRMASVGTLLVSIEEFVSQADAAGFDGVAELEKFRKVSTYTANSTLYSIEMKWPDPREYFCRFTFQNGDKQKVGFTVLEEDAEEEPFAKRWGAGGDSEVSSWAVLNKNFTPSLKLEVIDDWASPVYTIHEFEAGPTYKQLIIVMESIN